MDLSFLGNDSAGVLECWSVVIKENPPLNHYSNTPKILAIERFFQEFAFVWVIGPLINLHL